MISCSSPCLAFEIAQPEIRDSGRWRSPSKALGATNRIALLLTDGPSLGIQPHQLFALMRDLVVSFEVFFSHTFACWESGSYLGS
jgi:hypothetical protein